MPASTIVASGGTFRLYGDSVQTFDALPVATYAIAFDPMSGYSLRDASPRADKEFSCFTPFAAASPP